MHSKYDSKLICKNIRIAGKNLKAFNPEYIYTSYWKQCIDLNLLGLSISEEYGGLGLDGISTVDVMYEFGQNFPYPGLVFALGAHQFACSKPFSIYGQKILKEQYLTKLCNGTLIGANAMTETTGGSDISQIKTKARIMKNGYRLDGEKIYITNGVLADVIIVYAVTNANAGFLGITAFIVTKDMKGVQVTEKYKVNGMKGISLAKIAFDDVHVPKINLLGKEGQGLKIFHDSMHWERIAMFAGFLGIIQREFGKLIYHANTRIVSGKKIIKHQSVSHKLADIRLEIEACKALLEKAAYTLSNGEETNLYAAMVKLAISNLYTNFAHCCSNIYAGAACLTNHYSCNFLHDSVVSTVASGTSDIMRNIIAEAIKNEYH